METSDGDKKVISHNPGRADRLTREEMDLFYERGISPAVVNEFPDCTDLFEVINAVRTHIGKAPPPPPIMTPQEDSRGAWGEENPDIRVAQLY